MNVTSFRITNIECDACVDVSKKALQKIPSVTHVQINRDTGIAAVQSVHAIEWDSLTHTLATVGKDIESLT